MVTSVPGLETAHQGEPGSITGRVTGFSQVGIVPDDTVGRRVCSEISRFPTPSFIPASLRIHFNHPHWLSRSPVKSRPNLFTHSLETARPSGDMGEIGGMPSGVVVACSAFSRRSTAGGGGVVRWGEDAEVLMEIQDVIAPGLGRPVGVPRVLLGPQTTSLPLCDATDAIAGPIDWAQLKRRCFVSTCTFPPPLPPPFSSCFRCARKLVPVCSVRRGPDEYGWPLCTNGPSCLKNLLSHSRLRGLVQQLLSSAQRLRDGYKVLDFISACQGFAFKQSSSKPVIFEHYNPPEDDDDDDDPSGYPPGVNATDVASHMRASPLLPSQLNQLELSTPDMFSFPLLAECAGLAKQPLRRYSSVRAGSSFQDTIDVKHLYIEVDFAIGSQFVRHALDDSKPIADLQGNNQQLYSDVEGMRGDRCATGTGMTSRRQKKRQKCLRLYSLLAPQRCAPHYGTAEGHVALTTAVITIRPPRAARINYGSAPLLVVASQEAVALPLWSRHTVLCHFHTQTGACSRLHYYNPFKGKIDVKHVYTEVDFAIGSQFVRHALDDSEPIADLQGNNKRVPCCQDTFGCKYFYSVKSTWLGQNQLAVPLAGDQPIRNVVVYGRRARRHANQNESRDTTGETRRRCTQMCAEALSMSRRSDCAGLQRCQRAAVTSAALCLGGSLFCGRGQDSDLLMDSPAQVPACRGPNSSPLEVKATLALGVGNQPSLRGGSAAPGNPLTRRAARPMANLPQHASSQSDTRTVPRTSCRQSENRYHLITSVCLYVLLIKNESLRRLTLYAQMNDAMRRFASDERYLRLQNRAMCCRQPPPTQAVLSSVILQGSLQRSAKSERCTFCASCRTTRRRIEIASNPKLLVGRQNRSGLRRCTLHFIGCWPSCRARRGYAIPALVSEHRDLASTSKIPTASGQVRAEPRQEREHLHPAHISGGSYDDLCLPYTAVWAQAGRANNEEETTRRLCHVQVRARLQSHDASLRAHPSFPAYSSPHNLQLAKACS
ncbi:hypothetical protein PR048_024654 [Dryococelus australis]|uniref:Uncharacterized protein n=1 Tax=Dryococelus australis TaxID=614101 RepID=A0ABQ9GP97_9NEOP|nr:hypothetical protein PR048_024654 [Dryococelus australis]